MSELILGLIGCLIFFGVMPIAVRMIKSIQERSYISHYDSAFRSSSLSGEFTEKYDRQWEMIIRLHGIKMRFLTSGVSHQFFLDEIEWPQWLEVVLNDDNMGHIQVGQQQLSLAELEQLKWPELIKLKRAFAALEGCFTRPTRENQKLPTVFHSTLKLAAKTPVIQITYDAEISGARMASDLRKAITLIAKNLKMVSDSLQKQDPLILMTLYSNHIEHNPDLANTFLSLLSQYEPDNKHVQDLVRHVIYDSKPNAIATLLLYNPELFERIFVTRPWSHNQWLDVVTSIYANQHIDRAFKAQCLRHCFEMLGVSLLQDLQQQHAICIVPFNTQAWSDTPTEREALVQRSLTWLYWVTTEDALQWVALIQKEAPSLQSSTLFLRLSNRPAKQPLKHRVITLLINALTLDTDQIQQPEWLDATLTLAQFINDTQAYLLNEWISEAPTPSMFLAIEAALKRPSFAKSPLGKGLKANLTQIKQNALSHAAVGGLSLVQTDKHGALSVAVADEGQLTLSDELKS